MGFALDKLLKKAQDEGVFTGTKAPSAVIDENSLSDVSGILELMRLAKGLKKGGRVKKMAKGGSVSSASKRADGCATKGKTKGKMV